MQTALIAETKKREKIRIIDILTCVYCAFMFSGNTSDTYLYIAFGLFVLWTFVACITKPNFLNACINDKKVLCLLAVIVFSFICGLFEAPIFFLMKQVGGTFLLFSPILIFHYYRTSEKKSIRFVVGVMLICWVFFSIKAIHFYTENAGSAKTLTADSDAYGDIAIGGGMMLAFASAIFSAVLVDFIIQNKKRVLCIALLILSVYLLIKTESTVTLVCGFAGIVVSFVSAKGSAKGKLVRAIIAVVLLIVFAVNIEAIGTWIVEIGIKQESTFGDRLESFGYAMMGDAGGGEYALDRGAIMLQSINTFLKCPITGVCYQHGNSFYHPSNYGVGNHCAWFDFFANYGILFGLLFCMVYFYQIKELLKSKNFSKGWIFCLLLTGCFNPIVGFQPSMFIFFLIPALDLIMQANHQEGKGVETQ